MATSFLVLPLVLIILLLSFADLIDATVAIDDDDDKFEYETLYYDVLVVGANAAGVGAAVTASSNGTYTVKVVEPLHMIGGMAAAGGVSLMNQGGCGLTGLSKQWNQLVGRYYGVADGMPFPPFPRMKESELAFWELLNSSSTTIDVSLGCHPISVKFPTTSEEQEQEGCIGQVDFSCHEKNDPHRVTNSILSIKASYIIDASYDGDIMVLAGVDHTFGREPRSKYNESLAGVQVEETSDLESFARQNITINPYDDDGKLLKYISPDPLQTAGSGDDKLMAFQYFACLSTTPGNQVPFYPPKDYHADDFLLLLRQTKAVMAHKGKYSNGPPLSYFGDVQCYDPIVENVTGNRDCCFCCGTAPVNTDQTGLNQGWATSDYRARQAMADQYKYYLQGSLYFLSHDPRIPEFTKNDTLRYGYCKDEYEDFDNFPPQLYVRISNRLVGQKVLTQNNMANPRIKSDAVAMGCWVFDQHIVDRQVVDENNSSKLVRNEGFFRAEVSERGLYCRHPDAQCGQRLNDDHKNNTSRSKSSGCGGGDGNDYHCSNSNVGNHFPWYDVPFGVMVPAQKRQASNLLVPVALSASSVAYSSARIENMFMDLGSAAGVAVANLLDQQQQQQDQQQSIHRSIGSCPILAVQDTNVTGVQHILSTVYQQKFHGPDTSPDGTSSYVESE
eukprot:scaffold3248_cov112-Cylindrotheca_fusiformis.AAC.5